MPYKVYNPTNSTSAFEVDDDQSKESLKTWPEAVDSVAQDSPDPSGREQRERPCESAREPRFKNIVHLWEFLLELLANENCRSIVTWTREDHLEFKILNPEELAKRWGAFKRRKMMNYEKLSRALRYYYGKGIIKKVPKQRLSYKFHRLPYKYEPGVTRSRHHGHRISAYTEKPVPSVTRSRSGQRINGCTADVNGWSHVLFPDVEQQERREVHSAPPRTDTELSSASTPVPTPMRRSQSLPFIPTPPRPMLWYPVPVSLAPSLSDSRTRIMYPADMDMMMIDFEPDMPVKPVKPAASLVNHAVGTKVSSIPVSVITKI